MSDIETLERDLASKIAEAETEAALEDVRIAALGKKGAISERMKTLGKMSPEERKEAGPVLNGLKTRIAEAIEAKKMALEDAALDARLVSEKVDVTLPPRPEPKGKIHPVSQVMEEITAIFSAMGFDVAEGPDIEDDFHNFTALNFPRTKNCPISRQVGGQMSSRRTSRIRMSSPSDGNSLTIAMMQGRS